MMDRLTGVLLFAAFGCFILSFLLSSLFPYVITDGKYHEAPIEEVAHDVSSDFKGLKASYPVAFEEAFGAEAKGTLSGRDLLAIPEGDPRREASEKAWRAAYAKALIQGRDTYIADGCWHCHSQFVRPCANEDIRWGEVMAPQHYNNVLQRPMLFGTRRVGPDLTHEGGLRSNDWHAAHLWNPASTSPGSVMPRYTFYFRSGWRVMRYMDPEKAEIEGVLAADDFDALLDAAFPESGAPKPGARDRLRKLSYPAPGIYATEAAANAVVEELLENPPENMDEEVERLWVDQGRGPDSRALSLIAYLQWLGTWNPVPAEVQR